MAAEDSLEADFIIVGAGSAGCVMAARVSEDPSARVLLLEAGGHDDNRWIHIPLGFGKTFADASVNWCYETEPEPGAGGRRIYWPRGKVLGGSSSINGMVYIRGQHEDFDLWRQMGCTGWSATDVLPYFKRAEHQVRGPDPWHSTGGPLVVSDVAPAFFEVFSTSSSTKIGQSTRRARASASEGRESTLMMWPSRSIQMTA